MNSKAHTSMNHAGETIFPNGEVPWREATAPKTEGASRIGQLRSCAYCGSMHPADVAAAIKSGATVEIADQKYGWPHKSYISGVPNPHAGLPEVRSSATFQAYDFWIQSGNQWHEPPKPAPDKTTGKFYTVHLMDASEEDRKTIERELGLNFTFHDDGKVSWKPFQE